MLNYHFISYSSVDARDFSVKLYDSLKAEFPSVSVWMDIRDVKPGQVWDDEIVEAIRTCDSLIFVMTHDSVKSNSVCKSEWTRALRYKKPIVPILLHPEAEKPFILENRQYIDFTDNFEIGMAKLRTHLNWLASPEGTLQSMKERFEDAQRDLRRANDPNQRVRIEKDISFLEKQIANQQLIIANPEKVAMHVEENISRGIERERRPEKFVGSMSQIKFINPPPDIAPTYFQDRDLETKLIGDFLNNDSKCMMFIVGRAGIGKTTTICRLLKALEGGRLPDNRTEMRIDGIVYLSETGTHCATVSNIYADLSRLLPDNFSKRLDEIYRNPDINNKSKIKALIEAFSFGRVILLLDNFENLIDRETRTLAVTNSDMAEALRVFLEMPPHMIKVVITTRFVPRDLALIHPERQFHLPLNKGLDSPYAENILREMDVDGTLGLKFAPDKLLNEARERTRGNPRALIALFGILSADRDTTLSEILKDQSLLPENVVEVLVGEAFSRLDLTDQMIMEALAVYDRPVSPYAVDYLLQPYLPGVDSEPVLNRLVNMYFVQKENGLGRYYMHSVDREYALSRVPEGSEYDRDKVIFSRFALLNRGANYFKEARLPSEQLKTIDDLSVQLAEFDLRFEGKDYDAAASVLIEIDFDYLFLWGYYRLIIELHERLQGKLQDPKLKSASASHLGSAYLSVGKYQTAIEYYEQALKVSREVKSSCSDDTDLVIDLVNLGIAYRYIGQIEQAIGHFEQAIKISMNIRYRRGEGAALVNLGNACRHLGQIEKAIEYYEEALEILRDLQDWRDVGASLGSLGNAYIELGKIEKAIDYYEQALKISRELCNRSGEGIRLENLGNAYRHLGQLEKATEYCDQALLIHKEIGSQYGESAALTYKAHVLVEQYKFHQAVEIYSQAITISDEIRSIEFQNEARWGLAYALLCLGDLEAARSAVELARNCDSRKNNYNVLVLLGVIALRQGDKKSAKESFEAAVSTANILLNYCGKNYSVLDAKGLALCGLALCEQNKNYISDAINSYKIARSISKEKGIIGKVLLFNELAKADTNGLLVKVKKSEFFSE